MSDTPDEDRIDQALIDAACVGLFSERCGLPLHPWQQRFLDRMYIVNGPDSPTPR